MRKQWKYWSSSVILCLVSFHAISIEQPLADRDEFAYQLMTGQAQAEPYRPDCQIDDELCAIWSQFRALHPYPTQRLTAHIISDDELALVISEPSPALRKTELKELITTVFSTDLLEYREFKWMIGMDGWVEDIVVRLKKAKVSHQDKPSDELFSDRLALLEIALFGTTQGSDIETLDLTRPATDPIRLPNLELSAAEISDWITSKKIVWNTLDSPPRRIGHWMDQSIVGTRQVLLSDDKTLVMLSFPSSDIEWARRTGSLPDQMQSTFRSFAVNADVIIGGAWTDRQLAILARARQVPEKDFPPLRFETFELLAAQNSPELHQSYERTHLFAGKLTSGRYAFRDWAPIYLSPALIDTQFGALLNITDQMLKSWSQAGETEYLYFNYPQKPDRFPFDGRPISDLVYEKTGSQQVLFNWNTAGMGTVITGDPSILVTKRTGALPVTYGSELVEGGEMKTGHLQEFENEAYGYFANLEDPNLASVFQYTLIYQLFLAAVPVEETFAPYQAGPGSAVLIGYANDFINGLNSTTDDHAEIKAMVGSFLEQHAGIDAGQLAELLADPRVAQSNVTDYLGLDFNRYSETEDKLAKLIGDFNLLVQEYKQKETRHNKDVDEYNAKLAVYKTRDRISNNDYVQLKSWLDSIDKRDLELNEMRDDLARRQRRIEVLEAEQQKLAASLNQVGTNIIVQSRQLIRQIKATADPGVDLDEVRNAFSLAHSSPSEGWIKTPSSVISWLNRVGLDSFVSVGGHNLNSRTLHFEETPLVSELRIIETESGPIVQYPPSLHNGVMENATDIARAIEHKATMDPTVLNKIARQPGKIRPRQEALRLDEHTSAASVTFKPTRALPVGDKLLVGELEHLAGKNNCCVFVAKGMDGRDYLASTNPSPPPVAMISRFRDTPSLHQRLENLSKPPAGKPIVYLGEQGRADAMARSIRGEINRQAMQPTTKLERLKRVAQLINDPVSRARPSGDRITLMVPGRDNKIGLLHVKLETEGIKAQVQAAERLSATTELNTLRVREVKGIDVELDLPPRWREAAQNGELAMIDVSYLAKGLPGTPQNIYISSIARPYQVSVMRTEMANAADELIRSQSGQQATVGSVMIQIRDQIKERLRPLSTGKVEMLLKEERDSYHITQHYEASEANTGS